jgi:predicted AAA+ superfamily ATPase
MIRRTLEKKILAAARGKAIILLGARQVGKTTLARSLFGGEDALWLNGDEPDVRAMFEGITSARLRAVIGNYKVIVIDEAQRIPDIGVKLKLITDQIPDVRLVATGSSSFELTGEINEPLTGRKREFTLFPLSFAEMTEHSGLLDETRLLPVRLVYGYYPEVVTSQGSEYDVLRELSESYLYKDILALDRIKKSDGLTKLLRALAYQIGSQVSYSELAQTCGLNYKTVERYVEILEQAFIVFRLGSFSGNLRNELKSSRKIYFTDNGIRNAVINDFRVAENRDDVGKLWENFIVSERMKYNASEGRRANSYFWRTTQQREIDYIEEYDGELHAYEFKWSPSAKARCPRSFLAAYPNSSFKVIHRENIEEFLLSL